MIDQNSETSETPTTDPTRLEKLAKTSGAAKLSGKANKTAGFFKRKIGEITENPELKKEGENQELLGKIHSLVGAVRELQNLGLDKIIKIRSNGTKILLKHAGLLLDQATEFVADVRDSL